MALSVEAVAFVNPNPLLSDMPSDWAFSALYASTDPNRAMLLIDGSQRTPKGIGGCVVDISDPDAPVFGPWSLIRAHATGAGQATSSISAVQRVGFSDDYVIGWVRSITSTASVFRYQSVRIDGMNLTLLGPNREITPSQGGAQPAGWVNEADVGQTFGFPSNTGFGVIRRFHSFTVPPGGLIFHNVYDRWFYSPGTGAITVDSSYTLTPPDAVTPSPIKPVELGNGKLLFSGSVGADSYSWIGDPAALSVGPQQVFPASTNFWLPSRWWDDPNDFVVFNDEILGHYSVTGGLTRSLVSSNTFPPPVRAAHSIRRFATGAFPYWDASGSNAYVYDTFGGEIDLYNPGNTMSHWDGMILTSPIREWGSARFATPVVRAGVIRNTIIGFAPVITGWHVGDIAIG